MYMTLSAAPWPLTSRNSSNDGIGIKINDNADNYVLTFSFVLASLSQKLNFPSEPTVASVPCVGWKAMSFTYQGIELSSNHYSEIVQINFHYR